MKRTCDKDIFERTLSLFSQIPPNWTELDAVFQNYCFSKEQLAQLAADVADNCFCEYHDALLDEVIDITPDHMHSNHLLQSLQYLLDQGLDPNIFVGKDEENVMWNLQYVDAPNIGASAMRLMLENGADPNLIPPIFRESVFEWVAFAVSYDSYTHEDFHRVQCLLVLAAYGGHYRNGVVPLTMLNGNKVEIFKEFEHYDYELEMLPKEPGYYGCWIMHLYDTRTGEEVAQY